VGPDRRRTGGARAPVAEPDRPVAAAERARVVAGVLDSLRAAYVFPDAVAGMAPRCTGTRGRGAYDGLTARALADSLTAHLRAARRDGHLRVAYRPTSMAPPPPAADSAAVRAERARERAAAERANHGVHRVERLAGNVGYLALHAFAAPEGAGPALAAAMTLLAHTDALILDLRANGGGYPPTADLVASYLLDARPVHLLSFYHRPTDRTFDSWSLAAVPGPALRRGAARLRAHEPRHRVRRRGARLHAAPPRAARPWSATRRAGTRIRVATATWAAASPSSCPTAARRAP
jgi:hypothetical protein